MNRQKICSIVALPQHRFHIVCASACIDSASSLSCVGSSSMFMCKCGLKFIYRLLLFLSITAVMIMDDSDDGDGELVINEAASFKLNLIKRELEDLVVVVESWNISEKIRRDPLMREALEAFDNMKLEAAMLLTTNNDMPYEIVEKRFRSVKECYLEMRKLFNTNDDDSQECASFHREEGEACMAP